MKRIGIDARFYGSQSKGLGRYTQKLISYLEQIDTDNEYYIFLRRDNWHEYQPSSERFHKVLADYRWYTAKEQIMLPIVLLRYKLNLVHFTHFNVPLLYRRPFIVTIHDLILARYPTQRSSTLGPLLYWLKHISYRIIIRSAVRRARRVIAVSKFTKQDIIKHFTIRAEKISVTYESVDPLPEPHQDFRTIMQRYAISPPYILYVGNAYPHKNIEGLLRAYTKVVQHYPAYQLVLVGKRDYFFRRIQDYAATRGITQEVVFTGFVPDEELAAIYRGASVYVFPSFCEGFGLPALEACLYHVPVAASNNSSLPEILGQAAVFFDPHNPEEIAKTISSILDDPKRADELRASGSEQLKRFSWRIMAERTRDLYNAC